MSGEVRCECECDWEDVLVKRMDQADCELGDERSRSVLLIVSVR
jgi:hypothetical protein